VSRSSALWRSGSVAILHYAGAILAVAAAVVAGLVVDRFLQAAPFVSLLLCAILFASWLGGAGPGLLATGLSILGFYWFFIPASDEFVVQDVPRVALFAITALFVVWLSAAQRRTAQSLRRTRDDLRATVQELEKVNKSLQIENAERMRAEQGARQAERELQVMIDSIPAIAARYRPDGSLDFVNQTWRTYTGLSQESLRGHRWGVAIHPDDLPRVEAEWRAQLPTGEAFELEQRMRRADGEYRWHFVRRVPHRNDKGELIGWYGVAHDIEDQKRAEQALHRSERELRDLIETMPAMAVAALPDGSPTFVNRRWTEYTGLSTEDTIGSGWRTVIHPEDFERWLKLWRACLANGQPFEDEARFRRAADGEYRWFWTRGVPLRNEQGNIAGWYGLGMDIQDRKSAEQERERLRQLERQAERELRVTIDTIPALVARYRPDGSLDFVNQTWRTYTGLSQNSLRGQRFAVAVHPDDLANIDAAWRAHLATGQPFEMEQRLRRADGEYRWFLVRRVPLRNENGEVISWYGVGHDIEDQKRAERALQRSETYLAEAQRLSNTGSFSWKIGTDEIFWSKETYRIMGMDEMVKPTINLLMQRIHPEDRALVQRQLDRARREQDFDYECGLLMPNGDIKHIHVRAHRQAYAAGEEELVGALMDVTETRKAQEALQIAQTALAHVTRVTMLGEMSALIAHEVNQPLAAIVTNAEASLRWLGRDVPDVAETRAAIGQIVKNAHRASEVIRRIRDFSKKGDPEMIKLDINGVVEESVTLVRHEAFRHGVTIRLELAPALPPLRGDRIQLQQVVINLLVNAMQAMATVRDCQRVLFVRTQPYESDEVLVAVEDVGIGIEPEHADRLFTAFHTTKPEGLGMGLSICRSIIEAHGGRIWGSRNAGPGMTFQFTLSTHGQSG
jgi:PAS domain S-box-containing protein